MWEDLSHECHQVAGFHLSFFLGVGGGGEYMHAKGAYARWCARFCKVQ